MKTKEVRARLGDGDDLPDLAVVKSQIAQDMQAVVRRLRSGTLSDLQRQNASLRAERDTMLVRHREARQEHAAKLEHRRWEEARIRQSRFRTGLKGIWDWARGETERIRSRNEEEAKAAAQRDRSETDQLIFAQLSERRRIVDMRREIAAVYADRNRDIRGDLRACFHLARPSQIATSYRSRKRDV